MSARSLALSGGATVAMLAAPAAADECSDYRATFVLSEAASRASMEHSAELAEDMSRFDERHRPEYVEAELHAYRALDDAARAVRPTIAIDPAREAEAVAVHAIVAVRDTIEFARYLTLRVPGVTSPANKVFLSGGPTLGTAFGKLSAAFRDAKAAYCDALHFICFARDFEPER